MCLFVYMEQDGVFFQSDLNHWGIRIVSGTDKSRSAALFNIVDCLSFKNNKY